MKKLFPEFLGAFLLVFGGCGSAILVAGLSELGIELTGFSLILGCIVLAILYAYGYFSGRDLMEGHFNPTVSIGFWIGGKLNAKDLPGYVVAQVIGAVVALALLYFIVSVTTGFETVDNFAINDFEDIPLAHYSMVWLIIAEVVVAALFIIVVLKKTNTDATKGFGLVATGIALVFIYLINTTISNTLIDVSRSLSQTLFGYVTYLCQVWVFWVAPLIGAIIGGLIYEKVLKK